MKLFKKLFSPIRKSAISSRDHMRACTLIELERRSALAVCHDHGAYFQCLHGSLWITQLGVQEDILLSKGDSIHIAACRDVLVRAFSASRLEICLEQDSHHISADKSQHLFVEFVDQWYRSTGWAQQARLAVEGPFHLSVVPGAAETPRSSTP